MEPVDRNAQKIVPLESFLVSEFRAYQTLLKLSRQERKALMKADVLTLAGIVEQKDSLMDEIRRLEKGRSQVVRDWADYMGWSRRNPTIQEVIPHLPGASAERLKRIRTGILAISEELQDLTRGNQALAVSALERLDNMRTLILSFDQPPDHYACTGEKKISHAAASIRLEERA